VLTKIAEYNPKASSWWLFGLINHCSEPTITKPTITRPTITSNTQSFIYDAIDKMIKEMGEKIY